MYNLYLPDGDAVEKQYPLVLFMPDATGEGSDPVKTLTQGIGAVILASDEVQESHACMVLAPQYESGNDSAAITMELLQSVCREYNADEDMVCGRPGGQAGFFCEIHEGVGDVILFHCIK